jgi:hypothetical protein
LSQQGALPIASLSLSLSHSRVILKNFDEDVINLVPPLYGYIKANEPSQQQNKTGQNSLICIVTILISHV